MQAAGDNGGTGWQRAADKSAITFHFQYFYRFADSAQVVTLWFQSQHSPNAPATFLQCGNG